MLRPPSIRRPTAFRGASAGLRLTWSGHEFLDAMRDDNVWKKVRYHVIKPGVSWTVSLLFEALKNEARIRLGLPSSP